MAQSQAELFVEVKRTIRIARRSRGSGIKWIDSVLYNRAIRSPVPDRDVAATF